MKNLRNRGVTGVAPLQRGSPCKPVFGNMLGVGEKGQQQAFSRRLIQLCVIEAGFYDSAQLPNALSGDGVTNSDRRSFLSGIGLLCLGGTAGKISFFAGSGRAEAQNAVPAAVRQHGIVHLNRVETTQPLVALTFDDGPHPVHTPVLLDILAQHRARATFYVIGALVRRYPDIVRRMVAEGHELGNHTWTHPTLSMLGNQRFLSEIDRTQQVILDTVGHAPLTMRPPYGAITTRQSRMLSAERNLPTIIWSVDPQDWRRPGSAVVAQRMVSGARPGAIILAHDIHAPTVRAVPAALEGLRARGLRSVTLSELLGWGRWGPVPQRSRSRVAVNPHPRYSG